MGLKVYQHFSLFFFFFVLSFLIFLVFCWSITPCGVVRRRARAQGEQLGIYCSTVLARPPPPAPSSLHPQRAPGRSRPSTPLTSDPLLVTSRVGRLRTPAPWRLASGCEPRAASALCRLALCLLALCYWVVARLPQWGGGGLGGGHTFAWLAPGAVGVDAFAEPCFPEPGLTEPCFLAAVVALAVSVSRSWEAEPKRRCSSSVWAASGGREERRCRTRSTACGSRGWSSTGPEPPSGRRSTLSPWHGSSGRTRTRKEREGGCQPCSAIPKALRRRCDGFIHHR